MSARAGAHQFSLIATVGRLRAIASYPQKMPIRQKLPQADKLRLIQFSVSPLAQAEGLTLPEFDTCIILALYSFISTEVIFKKESSTYQSLKKREGKHFLCFNDSERVRPSPLKVTSLGHYANLSIDISSRSLNIEAKYHPIKILE